jgi:pSer/pThr/pTyr-binding forkhead associated (FHA) protein
MVQLQVLSGKHASTATLARRFPFVVGRNRTADLCLEQDGIWDRHLEFHLQIPDGFLLKAHPSALTSVNGQPVQQAFLRNGDVIEIGPLKIQFWLSETRQRGLRTREFLTWIALAALCAGQIVLIYALLS